MEAATMQRTELTWIQKFSLMIGAPTYIGHRKRTGWKDPLPFYACKCPTHGIVEDYPHGYEELRRKPTIFSRGMNPISEDSVKKYIKEQKNK